MLQGAVSGRHGVHRPGEPDQQLQQALHPRPQDGHQAELQTKVLRRFVITETAPTGAFSWLKAPLTSTFTFKTLLRHYAEQALKHSK